jgi:quinol-cytochrome oxidoreductase complex cytochrome b subunit
LKLTLALFFAVFLALGIYYMISGEILWGFLVITLALVYAFGFEHVYEGKRWHPMAHIFSGGIFSIIAVSFMVLEKLVSLLTEEPENFALVDILFIIAGGMAFLIAMVAKKEFE